MTEKYYSLRELLDMIDEPNSSRCEQIYLDNKEMFDKAKGSKVKHQAWSGGYYSHLRDAMNIGIRLYETFDTCRELPFSLSDSLLILYLHDLEKPWKYGDNEEKKKDLDSYENYQDFILSKVSEYDIELTDEHLNALKYVHGEGNNYSPLKNVQGPLAAFVHCCDTFSARIWHDEPKERGKW